MKKLIVSCPHLPGKCIVPPFFCGHNYQADRNRQLRGQLELMARVAEVLEVKLDDLMV